MAEANKNWKDKAGWGARGFFGGAAAVGVAWAAVGSRTPPAPAGRPGGVVLPYRAPEVVAAVSPQYTPAPVAAPVPVRPQAAAGSLPAVAEAGGTGGEPGVARAPQTLRPDPVARPAAGPRIVNLNTASVAELDLLPGIGPKLAARIISERERGGRYISLMDLQRVSGIGPRTAEKLEGLVSFE